MDFEVWDYESEREVSQFEMQNRPLTEVKFLPDGSWTASGFSGIYKQFLKYFPEEEPLNNKFSTIYILDYISEKFNITSISYYHFNAYAGKIVFTGWQDDENRFFVYDLKRLYMEYCG